MALDAQIIGVPMCRRKRFYRHSDCHNRETFDMGLGTRLRSERKAAGYTQEALAKASGIKQPTLSDIERGEIGAPSAPAMEAICRVLNLRPQWLLTGHGEKYVSNTTDQEQDLLDLFRAMPPHQQQAWLQVGRAMLPSRSDGDMGSTSHLHIRE